MKKLIVLASIVVIAAFQAGSIWAACVTGDVTPPAKVTDLKTNAIGATGIIYSFTTPSDASTLAETDLRFRTGVPLTALNWATATQIAGEPTPSNPGTMQSANMNGLTPSVKYYMALKVKDACGKWNIMSNVFSFTTIANPKREVTLDWQFTPPADKVMQYLKIMYGTKSISDPTYTGSEYSIWSTPEYAPKTFFVDPGQYFFYIQAIYADGTESLYSSEYPFAVPPI